MVVAQRVTASLLPAALLAVLLSGCLGAGPGPDDSTGAPPPGPDVAGPRAWTLRLEGCKGFFANFRGPASAVRAEVPQGFRTYSSLSFYGLRCERAADDHRVYENVSLSQFFARVDLENQSWGNPGSYNFYGLDSFAAPREFAQALAGLRVVPLESSEFQLEVLAGAAGGKVQRWRYTSPNASLEFEFGTTGQRAGGGPFAAHDWYGMSNVSRVDRYSDSRVDYAVEQAGAFRVSGQTRVGRITGSSVIAYSGQPYDFVQEAWLVNETYYRG